MRLFIAALLTLTALSAYPALADITGPAIVTDGDTIKIDGQRIRIHGIDAPEITISQSCSATLEISVTTPHSTQPGLKLCKFAY